MEKTGFVCFLDLLINSHVLQFHFDAHELVSTAVLLSFTVKYFL